MVATTHTTLCPNCCPLRLLYRWDDRYDDLYLGDADRDLRYLGDVDLDLPRLGGEGDRRAPALARPI